MDKAGWQVASGVLAMALIGTGFALMATRGVLAQERNDRRECPTAEPETVIVREHTQPVTVHVDGMPVPDNVSCRGGVYLIRTEQGIESLTKSGHAISCSSP